MPPPLPFREISPGQVELRTGGGWLALFGLPFFLAGIAMMLAAIQGLPGFSLPAGLFWASLLLFATGLIFAGVGGGFLLGRTWIVFDVPRGTITRSRGMLVKMRRRERRLGEFQEVLILYQAGDDNSSERYPIFLHTLYGRDLHVCVAANFAEAYRLAEFLARFLNLNLADSTTDRTLPFDPGSLGETFQQRSRRTQSSPEVVARPAAAISEVEESNLATGGCTVRIVIPKTTIMVSRSGIQIEKQGSRRPETKVIPAEEILDVDCGAMDRLRDQLRGPARRALDQSLGKGEKVLAGLIKLLPSQGITVKSQQGMFLFGEGLEIEELQYLLFVTQKTLLS